jgi:hypothetical protein
MHTVRLVHVDHRVLAYELIYVLVYGGHRTMLPEFAAASAFHLQPGT